VYRILARRVANRIAAGLLLLAAGAGQPAAAQPAAGAAVQGRNAPPAQASLPAVSARPPIGPKPAVLWYPGFARDGRLRSAWLEALEAERAHDYREAAGIFEKLIHDAPEEPHTYWRIARDYAWISELTPPSDRETRARYGTLAMAWADRGLKVDPRCSECCFYKYAGMGRVALAHGILSSMSWLKQLGQTLDQCMQNPPSFAHAPWDSELGNLYYAAATFYRLLPNSRMLEISVGVRGDRRRSLEFARRSTQVSDRRIDYNVGLAAALLCVGREDDRQELVAEGRSLLERVPQLDDLIPTDPIDRRSAARLLSEPDRACGYSRDEWSQDESHVARSGS
jgi:hypothetical protein